jgi:hypothetical protein
VYVNEVTTWADGTKMALIHFRRIGLDCIDIKLCLVNGENESISRVFLTITDDKAIKSKEIDDSSTSSRLRLHVVDFVYMLGVPSFSFCLKTLYLGRVLSFSKV